MKKNILIVIFILILFFLTGCGIDREKDNPDVIIVGENCDIYDYVNGHSEFIATVTYNGCAQEEINDNPEMILITETITITPVTSIKLTSDDFLLAVGYEFYENNEDKYRTNEEYNIEKNQFNIFENDIVEETTYEFCFLIPKEKNGFKYDQVGFSLLIFNSYVLCYTFNLPYE